MVARFEPKSVWDGKPSLVLDYAGQVGTSIIALIDKSIHPSTYHHQSPPPPPTHSRTISGPCKCATKSDRCARGSIWGWGPLGSATRAGCSPCPSCCGGRSRSSGRRRPRRRGCGGRRRWWRVGRRLLGSRRFEVRGRGRGRGGGEFYPRRRGQMAGGRRARTLVRAGAGVWRGGLGGDPLEADKRVSEGCLRGSWRSTQAGAPAGTEAEQRGAGH